MFKTKTFLLCLFYCYSINGLAQDYIYKNFTTEDGLSSSEVYDITQDKNGFLWFATDRGLTRYDGSEFKKYTLDDGLTDIVIFNFYEQLDGKILCSTFNKKIFYYDPDKDLFSSYPHNELLKGFSINNTINNIRVDGEQNLFITFKGLLGYLKINNNGTYVKKLEKKPKDLSNLYFKIGKNADHYSYFDKYDNQTLPNSSEYLYKNYSLKSGAYYNVSHKPEMGLVIISLNKNIYLINIENDAERHILENNEIIISGEYDEQHFWVGLQHGGVKIYNYEGKLVEHLLKDKSVTKLMKDHEGSIWISTIDSGIFYIKNPLLKTYKISGKSNNVYRLAKNAQNILYIGNHNGEVYKRNGNRFNLMYKSPGNFRATVQYYQKDNRLLMLTLPYIWEENQEGGLKKISQHSGILLSDNSRFPPISGQYNFFKYNKDKESIKIIKNIYPLRALDIDYSKHGYYIATSNGLYEYKNDSLYDLRNKHPLFNQRLQDIDQYQEHHYITSMGMGLIIKDTDTIYNIDKSKGLNSNLTNQVYVENNNEVYVTSNTGFNRVFFNENHKSYSITGFSSLDGLPSNEVNDVEVINDTIWIATKKGLYSIPKSIVSSTNIEKNKDWLTIRSIKVNNQIIKDSLSLKKLNYDENSITIDFRAISFRNGEDILYRYRLVGLEKKWNLTKNRQVKYPELQPGTYTFELETKIANKDWSLNNKKITFTIRPPFWSTVWFKALIILLISSIIYSFFKYRILLYNKDIIRELLRFILKKINGKTPYIVVKESGNNLKINTQNILYIKSSGNYLEIYTKKKNHVIRGKISDYEKQMPDKLEFIRIHRSYLIRIDKVQSKSNKSIKINNETIPVGKTYKENLEKIIF